MRKPTWSNCKTWSEAAKLYAQENGLSIEKARGQHEYRFRDRSTELLLGRWVCSYMALYNAMHAYVTRGRDGKGMLKGAQ